MRRLLHALAGLLLGFYVALLGAAPDAAGQLLPIPTLKARVTDLTGSLDAGQKAALEQQLATLEASKGAQLAVLVLPSTRPETIEQFGIRLMEAWKIGRKGVDDGVLLIVAKDDRDMRIEVGYGLEGALNDATAKRIIAETITPLFKADDLPGGIQAGVDAIAKVIDGEALPEPQAAPSWLTDGGGTWSFDDVSEMLFFGALFVIVVGGTALRHLLGNLLGCGIVGGVTGGLGWLFIGGLVGIGVGALAGIFLAVFGLDLLLSGIFSGGSGGSSSGGGGFSGGGGSGGGGGASGSW